MNQREWLLLIALSLLWGASFLFVGIAVRELPPLTIVAVRVIFAAPILWIVIAVLRLPVPASAGIWLAFFGMGLLNNVIPFVMFTWGQQFIASGLAAILNATTPLFTVLVVHMSTSDEKLTRGKLIGVVLGLAGVVLMFGADLLAGIGDTLLAELACLAAALSYAFAAAFGRRFKRLGVPPLVTASGQITASACIMLPLVLFESPWLLPIPGAPILWSLFGLALFSTSLAYILYFRILDTAGATNVQLVTFLIPVSAILLGWIVLGERLALRHFAGMALIALGLGVIDGRLQSILKRGNRVSTLK